MDGLDLDVMHDQLEGVLPLEIKLLLKKCVREEEYFTVETLNERIQKFDYGPPDMSNKPSPIKQQALSNDSASISQSGTYHGVICKCCQLSDCVTCVQSVS